MVQHLLRNIAAAIAGLLVGWAIAPFLWPLVAAYGPGIVFGLVLGAWAGIAAGAVLGWRLARRG